MTDESDIEIFDFSKTPSEKRKIETSFYQSIDCDSLGNGINLDQLVFTVPPMSETVFIDTSHTRLYLKIQLTRGSTGSTLTNLMRGDGSTVETVAKKRVYTLNHIGPSLIRNIFFKIRHMYVKGVENAGLISYLRRLTTPDSDNLDKLAGFYKLDEAGKMDLKTNSSLEKRAIFGEDAQEFVFSIEHPLFLQKKPIPAKDELQLILGIQNPQYYLQSFENSLSDGYFTVKILAAQLHLKFLNLDPSLQKSVTSQMKRNLNYEINQVDTYDIPLNSNTKEFTKNIFINDICPDSAILLLIDDSHWSGDYAKNSFNFEKHGLESIGLLKNGKLIDGHELNASSDVDMYQNLSIIPDIAKTKLSEIGVHDLSKGYFIMPFLLKHPLDSESANETCNLSASLRFSSSPPENLHLVAITFRNSIFTLKSDGNFFYD